MNATRLSVIVALTSLLSTAALAAEPFTAEQEQQKLLQLQRSEELQGSDASLGQVTRQVWPQRTEEFSTYVFVRTDWKVHNPNGTSVQVNLRCNRYGYDMWFWIAPYDTITGAWGCEGQTLYVYNNAPPSGLFVQATTW
jgi:hypothetical protein